MFLSLWMGLVGLDCPGAVDSGYGGRPARRGDGIDKLCRGIGLLFRESLLAGDGHAAGVWGIVFLSRLLFRPLWVYSAANLFAPALAFYVCAADPLGRAGVSAGGLVDGISLVFPLAQSARAALADPDQRHSRRVRCDVSGGDGEWSDLRSAAASAGQ